MTVNYHISGQTTVNWVGEQTLMLKPLSSKSALRISISVVLSNCLADLCL